MKILYFGSGAFGLPSLQAIHASNHTLLGIVTNPDKAQGRSQEPKANPIKAWALEHQVPVMDYSSALGQIDADLWVVIAFGKILPKAMLSIPKFCALNVHASLLPLYRGASPIQSALLNGESRTGVTVMRLEEGLDTGAILVQREIAISPNDYFLDLEKNLSQESALALLEAIGNLDSKNASFMVQEERLASLCRKISKEQGHLNWNESARNIRNKIRAFQKWPGSYSFYEGKRIIWRRVDIKEGSSAAPHSPGSILTEAFPGGLQIATPDGIITVRELQLEGRRAISTEDFLKGFKLEAGHCFD